MPKAVKTHTTKPTRTPDIVLDLKRRRDSLHQSRIKADEGRDGEKVDELTGAIDILEGMASLTPAVSVEGALFQLDLAIDTLTGDLFENIPVVIRPRIFDAERKIARLLESVGRVLRAQLGEDVAGGIDVAIFPTFTSARTN
jgi:hypothetical protein